LWVAASSKETIMNKLVMTSVLLGVLVLGSGPVRAQNCSFSQAQSVNGGPYYATPSWNQQIPATQRFVCLLIWNSEAVLDLETGLVWQRTPQIPGKIASFTDAVDDCYSAATGGRKGWRLPAPEELLSLVDPTQNNPALPVGNPFQQIAVFYWSATTAFPPTPTTAGAAVVVDFLNGITGISNTLTGQAGVWCVRGGSHVLTAFGASGP
jgi:hypothetical protein